MRPSRLVGLIALALGVLAAPSGAPAQAPGKIPHVGAIYLSEHHQVIVDGLRQGLRDLGLEEGKHYVLDIREIADQLIE